MFHYIYEVKKKKKTTEYQNHTLFQFFSDLPPMVFPPIGGILYFDVEL